MNLEISLLQEKLCNLMCASVKVHSLNNEFLTLETPFTFPDGDPYQLYIKELANGTLRLSDMGHTLMHLSYENDIDKFRDGTRGKLFEQIKSEFDVLEDNGEMFIDTTVEDLGQSIFRIGQVITKLNDLTFLNRARAESTFYDDLEERLYKIVSEDRVEKDYHYSGMDNAEDYPIDFYIQGKHLPLYIFGVANRDKARLTTITLERLLRVQSDFDSLLIFSDLYNIPRKDLARLSNAGGEMIASLDAESDFSRKLLKKVG